MEFLNQRKQVQLRLAPPGTVSQCIGRIEDTFQSAETVVLLQYLPFPVCGLSLLVFKQQDGAYGFDVATKRFFLVICIGVAVYRLAD